MLNRKLENRISWTVDIESKEFLTLILDSNCDKINKHLNTTHKTYIFLDGNTLMVNLKHVFLLANNKGQYVGNRSLTSLVQFKGYV